MRATWERAKHAAKSAALELLHAIRPRVTPMLILKALLGILLFFIGIIMGIWFIIRYRRQLPGQP